MPEYVLTYAFMVIFASYCLFMHYWRVILPRFGIKPRKFAYQPRPPHNDSAEIRQNKARYNGLR